MYLILVKFLPVCVAKKQSYPTSKDKIQKDKTAIQ